MKNNRNLLTLLRRSPFFKAFIIYLTRNFNSSTFDMPINQNLPASTSAEQKCFRIEHWNETTAEEVFPRERWPDITQASRTGAPVTTGVPRQGGHETHGETDPLGSEILNGNDYSKLLLLGLGVPNSHSVGLLKPVHPFVQPLIPPPESTLQIFIVSTLFQARLGP